MGQVLLPPNVGGGLIWGSERALGTVVVAACYVVLGCVLGHGYEQYFIGCFFVGCHEEATIVCGWCQFVYDIGIWVIVFGYVMGTCFVRFLFGGFSWIDWHI